MIQLSHCARRVVLLLIAFATGAVGWEASALAGSETFTWNTYGALDTDDEFMVTFDVWDTSPPMPHYELDTTIAPLYLTYTNSELVTPPSYYVNHYSGTRSGFVSGKLYKAKFHFYWPGIGWHYYGSQHDILWTEP